MKAVLHYRASPGFRQRLAEAAPEGLSITVVEEADGVGDVSQGVTNTVHAASVAQLGQVDNIP